MARTAAQEHFGASLDLGAISANVNLPLPSGPGGVRFFAAAPTTPGHALVLQDARLMRPSGQPQAVVYNGGTQSIELRDHDGAAIATIAAGAAVQAILVTNTTAAGVWIARSLTAQASSPITTGRIQYRWEFRASQLTTHLRVYANAHGYDGITPVALHVTLGPHTFGALRTDTYGFDTGSFPSGSTLFLVLEDGCIVTGRGGAGGRGSDLGAGLLAQPGGDGGTAMVLRIPTAIVNYGTIQGGGGGGGGGARTASAAGGGGGGGAGHRASDLGLKGTGGGATNGGQGFTSVPGSGGIGGQAGGGGGYPANDGAAAGAAGGLAGYAINRSATGLYTLIRTGTILGAQVATL